MHSPESLLLNPDFADFLRALSEADALYLVVGGYAIAVHAAPRATGDLDVWVDATPENAERVYRALTEFGAPLHDLSTEDLATPEIVFQMGVPPRRLDVLTTVSGVAFADAWPNRVTIAADGLQVTVIGRADLIANKRASGRPQDLADVAALEKYGDADR